MSANHQATSSARATKHTKFPKSTESEIVQIGGKSYLVGNRLALLVPIDTVPDVDSFDGFKVIQFDGRLYIVVGSKFVCLGDDQSGAVLHNLGAMVADNNVFAKINGIQTKVCTMPKQGFGKPVQVNDDGPASRGGPARGGPARGGPARGGPARGGPASRGGRGGHFDRARSDVNPDALASRDDIQPPARGGFQPRGRGGFQPRGRQFADGKQRATDIPALENATRVTIVTIPNEGACCVLVYDDKTKASVYFAPYIFFNKENQSIETNGGHVLSYSNCLINEFGKFRYVIICHRGVPGWYRFVDITNVKYIRVSIKFPLDDIPMRDVAAGEGTIERHDMRAMSKKFKTCCDWIEDIQKVINVALKLQTVQASPASCQAPSSEYQAPALEYQAPAPECVGNGENPPAGNWATEPVPEAAEEAATEAATEAAEDEDDDDEYTI